jgi:hypothetical protein
MNMILDFALDYIGFCLMISGFFVAGRVVTEWIQSFRINDLKTFRDIERDDWIELGIAVAVLFVGRLLTLY